MGDSTIKSRIFVNKSDITWERGPSTSVKKTLSSLQLIGKDIYIPTKIYKKKKKKTAEKTKTPQLHKHINPTFQPQ